MDRKDGEVWIPNINVVHAVYARTALTKQDYSKALSEAKLARKGYPLMSSADYKAGFCNPTSEWLFGSFGSAQENNWYWGYGTQYACNGYYANAEGSPNGAGPIGRELINRIPNQDTRKALFLSEDRFPGYDWNNEDVIDPDYAIFYDENLISDATAYIKKNAVSGLDAPAAQAALVELNATSRRNPEYTCTKTGEDLWNEIMDYREVELWGEGAAWSDYKRWNRPVARTTIAQGGNAYPSVAITIPADGANKWTWDVPLNETDYNDELNLGGK